MIRLPQPYENDEAYEDYRENAREEELARQYRVMNTPVGKWAPADFVYDPLSRKGYE